MAVNDRANMSKQTVLTGITTTGTPHLGNYVGAIRPAIAASQSGDVNSFYFLADYHALVKNQDPAEAAAVQSGSCGNLAGARPGYQQVSVLPPV